jgi:two-component SAPR family response regulator
MTTQNKPERGENWHIGKEIPIALVFGIVLQTMTAIWWAAGVTQELKNLSAEISDMRAARYTQSDSIKDAAVASQRMSDLERRMDNAETELTRVHRR